MGPSLVSSGPSLPVVSPCRDPVVVLALAAVLVRVRVSPWPCLSPPAVSAGIPRLKHSRTTALSIAFTRSYRLARMKSANKAGVSPKTVTATSAVTNMSPSLGVCSWCSDNSPRGNRVEVRGGRIVATRVRPNLESIEGNLRKQH